MGINEDNNLTLLDFGYIGSGDDLVMVMVAFDKNPDTVKSYLFKRADSNIIRLKEDLYVYELATAFSKYNLAEFRVYNDMGDTYEFTISLSGFTKVYNKLFPNGINEAKKVVAALEKKRIEIKKEEAKKERQKVLEEAKKEREKELKELRLNEIANKESEWLEFFKNELYPQLLELQKKYPLLLKPKTSIYNDDWILTQADMYINGIKPDLTDVNKLKFTKRGEWVDLILLKENSSQTDTIYRQVYSLNFANTFKN